MWEAQSHTTGFEQAKNHWGRPKATQLDFSKLKIMKVQTLAAKDPKQRGKRITGVMQSGLQSEQLHCNSLRATRFGSGDPLSGVWRATV